MFNTERTDRKFRIIYILFMIVIATFGASDLAMDYLSIKNLFHRILEFLFIIFALVSGSYMWYYHRQSEKVLVAARRLIGNQNVELEEWNTRHAETLREMQNAIVDRFKKWELSPSEIEVAVLIIRGYSHKQISGLLDKSERTVRNQSLNIYKKTGMTGRNELAAYFLEDIFNIGDQEDEEE